jgi:Protein of unknown function (DUF1579)
LTVRFFRIGRVPQENHDFILKEANMTRISVLLFLLILCFATAMQAQAPAPKPGPEVKKLHAYLGHWTYEGEAKPGPGCLGGKFTGQMTCQMILGGFFLRCRFTEKEPDGDFRFFAIEGYDPVNKNFTHDGYAEDGSKGSSVLTMSGNKWTHAGRWVSEGKQYHYKGTFTFAPDLASGTFKDELSLDGKSWTTCEESKYTKVKPPARK